MNFLYEPSLYNISIEDWNIEEKKDLFIEELLKCMNFLEVDEGFVLLWTDELEELMWLSPQTPPWRTDKDFANSFVPIIYKKLADEKNKFNIDINHTFSTCNFNPQICYSEKYEKAFKNLSSQIVFNKIPITLILSSKQEERNFTDIICSEPETKEKYLSISNLTQIIKEIDLINEIWPKNIEDKTKFCSFIISIIPSEKLINEFEIDNSFIKDLIEVIIPRHRLKIVKTICYRLTIDSSTARGCTVLREENINPNNIRIRVTQKPTSTRIHFKFNGSRINFLRYYGEGEHDDGL